MTKKVKIIRSVPLYLGFLFLFTPAYVSDSEATTVTALREDFNGLLAMLREAGILAFAPAEDEQPSEE